MTSEVGTYSGLANEQIPGYISGPVTANTEMHYHCMYDVVHSTQTRTQVICINASCLDYKSLTRSG